MALRNNCLIKSCDDQNVDEYSCQKWMATWMATCHKKQAGKMQIVPAKAACSTSNINKTKHGKPQTMKFFARILFFMSTMAVLSGCNSMAGLEHPHIILMEARINDIKLGRPNIPKPNVIEFYSEVIVFIGIEEVLIGHLKKDHASVVTRMHSSPNLEVVNNIYFLAEQSQEGELRIINWWLGTNNLCMSRERARELGIEKQMLTLYGNAKIKCKSWKKGGWE
ncbi:hypothetical protein DFR42_1298 [Undibacterium pigrum]|uniref:Uncharacterized protein n=1 Tax=Undibacterium pigrum TaxID=401470 RepID=A0A318IJM4_9BURK|nr:hypothetical protein DFR42_1298 [Undibacterium pigrum]